MAAISQTMFWNAFPWMETSEFRKCLIEICSSVSNWQYIIIDLDNVLAPIRRQVIIWTSDGLINWRIYATLGLNVLKRQQQIVRLFHRISFHKQLI